MPSTHWYEPTFNQECEESVNKLDAVNKAVADRIKYKSATGTIPNTVRTHSSHFPIQKILLVER